MSDDQTTTMWLVQPVSPDLNHEALAERVGCKQLLGVLPRNKVDHPQRMVLVMGPGVVDDDEVDRRLKESKFVCGFKRDHWHIVGGGYPFDQPDFLLYTLSSEHVQSALKSESEDGAINNECFLHSSKLPDWPS